jgi:hypothetical protein
LNHEQWRHAREPKRRQLLAHASAVQHINFLVASSLLFTILSPQDKVKITVSTGYDCEEAGAG